MFRVHGVFRRPLLYSGYWWQRPLKGGTGRRTACCDDLVMGYLGGRMSAADRTGPASSLGAGPVGT
jgi:hypothetical protein